MRMGIAGVISLAFLVSSSLADTVRLTDGTVLRGKIKGKTAEKVMFEYEKGKLKTIERSEIEAIEKDDFEFPSTPPGPKKEMQGKPSSQPKGDHGKTGAQPSGGTQAAPDSMGSFISVLLDLGAKLDKIRDTVGLHYYNPQALLSAMEMPVRVFIQKNGAFNKDADGVAIKAAVDNITSSKVDKAVGLILAQIPPYGVGLFRAEDLPRLAAYSLLLGASGEFVCAKGKVNLEAFDAAFANVTIEKVRKTQGLVKDQSGASEPLYLLMRASGHFVDKEGKFDKDAFNASLDALTPEKIAAKMKEMKQPAIDTAFYNLLQPSVP